MSQSIAQSSLEDASGFQGRAEALHVPANEAELAALLREASASAIPITIAGAGTGVAGGRCAQGGWIVSMEKFVRLEISAGAAVCGAGVLLKEVQEAAAAAA